MALQRYYGSGESAPSKTLGQAPAACSHIRSPHGLATRMAVGGKPKSRDGQFVACSHPGIAASTTAMGSNYCFLPARICLLYMGSSCLSE